MIADTRAIKISQRWITRCLCTELVNKQWKQETVPNDTRDWITYVLLLRANNPTVWDWKLRGVIPTVIRAVRPPRNYYRWPGERAVLLLHARACTLPFGEARRRFRRSAFSSKSVRSSVLRANCFSIRTRVSEQTFPPSKGSVGTLAPHDGRRRHETDSAAGTTRFVV